MMLSGTGVSTLPGEKGLLTLEADAGKAGRVQMNADYSIGDRQLRGHLHWQDAELTHIWPCVQQALPLPYRKTVQLHQGSLDSALAFAVTATDTVKVHINDGHLALKGLALHDPQNTPLLNLSALQMKDMRVDLQKRRLRVGEVRIEGASLPVTREADGRLHWQRMLPTPKSALAAAGKPWHVEIPSVSLQKINLHVIDKTVSPATHLDIRELQAQLQNFDSTLVRPVRLSLNSVIGAQGRLAATGEMALDVPSVQLQLKSQDIDLSVLQSYLSPFVHMALLSGRLDSDLQLAMTRGEAWALSVNGDLRVHQLHVMDTLNQQDLVKWQQLQLDGVQYQHQQHLHIDKMTLEAPYSRFVIHENRSTNLGELVIARSDGNASGTALTSGGENAAKISRPLSIRIGEINIQGGAAHFADYSLTPNFSTDIDQLNGKITTLDNQDTTPVRIEVHGKVDRYAPVVITGQFLPFAPLRSLDINASFKRIELTSLTPYSGKFAGYRIRKGRLNLDLHYQIQEGQLKAQNKVMLEALQLGERVDSPDAVDLPVRLAVNLLKDKRGNIKVDLPVEGDLNNPKFRIGRVIWKTLSHLVLRVVKSPFSVIGGWFKGEENSSLDSIAFAPGSSALSSVAMGQLQTVAAALRQRPELRLEIEGASSRVTDGERSEVNGSERHLHQLARARAVAIKAWLVEQGGLKDQRVYLLNTRLHETGEAHGVISRLLLDSR